MPITNTGVSACSPYGMAGQAKGDRMNPRPGLSVMRGEDPTGPAPSAVWSPPLSSPAVPYAAPYPLLHRVTSRLLLLPSPFSSLQPSPLRCGFPPPGPKTPTLIQVHASDAHK